MQPYAETTIHSLQAYIGFLSESCRGENWLFRGQNYDHPLLPKIARPEMTLGSTDAVQAEKQILEDFRRDAVPYLPPSVCSEWDLLVVGQHHGLATRLLDWSLNPLAALWFAVKEVAVDDYPGVVWAFHYDEALVVDPLRWRDPFQIQDSGVLRPSHIVNRVVAQRGWFTVHARYDRGFRVMETSATAASLTKIVIPGAGFSDLRYDLDRCGVNSATLFPDLDGICRHIVWRHTCLRDELEDCEIKS